MKTVPRWVKVVVACVLLTTLAVGVDWTELPKHLARLDLAVGLLAMLVVAAELPVNATKWGWSLRLHDVRFPWLYLFRTGCFGFFFNNFLPSAIGGDVYRVIRTAGGVEAERSRAVSAVLVERVVGLTAMLLNGLAGALFLMGSYALAQWYVQLALIGIAGALVVGSLVWAGLFRSLQRRLESVAFLAPVWANARRIGRLRFEWLPLLAASFVFQFMAAAVVYLAFRGIGESVPVSAALLITAAAGIASVLPISISGIGVVEGSIAGTAVALGVSYEGGVLAALIVRLVVLPVSAACGLLYLTERNPVAIREPSS
jgi:glycosyltransferase 2 family protein